VGLCAPSAAADQKAHVHNQKKSLEETIQDEEAAIADVTEAIATLEPLAKLIKEVLGDKIEKVAVLSRKAHSPCIRKHSRCSAA